MREDGVVTRCEPGFPAPLHGNRQLQWPHTIIDSAIRRLFQRDVGGRGIPMGWDFRWRGVVSWRRDGDESDGLWSVRGAIEGDGDA